MWGVYLWKAGDSVAKKKCTLENRRSNKWLNGLKKKGGGGGRKKTNNKKADNKIRCLHWIWRVCKTAQSLFPNLQKTNPENNTEMWSNKEKVHFFFPVPISNVRQLHISLSHQTALVSWQLRAGFKYNQNGLFLELLLCPNQVLTLAMLLTLPLCFPGGRGDCLSQQQGLLQLARPNNREWRWVQWCQSILAHVLAAILLLAVSGASPWLGHHPLCPPSTPSVYGRDGWAHPSVDLRWDLLRWGEKVNLGPERLRFCMVPETAAALYSQACNIHVAMWLQCCDRSSYTCTLQFSCCFLPTLVI